MIKSTLKKISIIKTQCYNIVSSVKKVQKV